MVVDISLALSVLESTFSVMITFLYSYSNSSNDVNICRPTSGGLNRQLQEANLSS